MGARGRGRQLIDILGHLSPQNCLQLWKAAESNTDPAAAETFWEFSCCFGRSSCSWNTSFSLHVPSLQTSFHWTRSTDNKQLRFLIIHFILGDFLIFLVFHLWFHICTRGRHSPPPWTRKTMQLRLCSRVPRWSFPNIVSTRIYQMLQNLYQRPGQSECDPPPPPHRKCRTSSSYQIKPFQYLRRIC